MSKSNGKDGEKSLKETDYSNLVNKRAVIKRKITNTLKRAAEDDSVANVNSCIELIEISLCSIKDIDEEINSIICSITVNEQLTEECVTELDRQSDYVLSVNTDLAKLRGNVKDSIAAVSNCKLKLPDLKCEYFSGEGTNELQFHSFITHFNNVIGHRDNLSNGTKLTYLKTYLKGYAYKLVQHLQINDYNYEIALTLLKAEFLNVDALVEDLIKRLFALKPKSDNFMDVKIYINDIRCILSDLTTYGYDMQQQKSSKILISHLVFHKLPTNFQQELVRKLNCNYPSINDVFEHYVDIIRTINLKTNKATGNTKTVLVNPCDRLDGVTRAGAVAPQSNYNEKTKYCKFCSSTGHSMLRCQRYSNYGDRKARCAELKLCFKCSSQKHLAKQCKPLEFACIHCKAKDHISALCQQSKLISNFCINSASESGQTFILPTLTVKLECGNRHAHIRCLVDTGSQRSYVSSNVLNKLNVTSTDSKAKLLISTFIDTAYRSFAQASLTLTAGGKKYVLPFLINDEVCLKYKINGLTDACANIAKDFTLTEKCDSDEVILEALLGVDALQCFKDFKVVPCLGGSAFSVGTSMVPFGHVDNFLTTDQLKIKYAKLKSVNNVDTVDKSIVNFVLDPVKSYFDPIESIVKDSHIDGCLDNMFSLESLGIPEESSKFDDDQIIKFENGIKFADGKYTVELPWNEKISEVKPNFKVCCGILNKVVEHLKRNKLYDQYEAVLKQQLENGIIEQIPLDEINVDDHVWIPHRAVIKTESQTTTKVRVVLNCSLHLGGAPSLNEAAYPGVDLLSSLLELLIKTRSNDYLVMSDIRQAFLMIGLSNESDRNKFSILWQTQDGTLVAYRYKTIVFGYASSSFILSYVIRHHVSKYPKDSCSDVLNNHMYVDNLLTTHNNLSDLKQLYKDCYDRMKEGGFELRSWTSNSPDLNLQFQHDGRATSHECHSEKMLGYRFFPATDQIALEQPDSTLILVLRRDKSCLMLLNY